MFYDNDYGYVWQLHYFNVQNEIAHREPDDLCCPLI